MNLKMSAVYWRLFVGVGADAKNNDSTDARDPSSQTDNLHNKGVIIIYSAKIPRGIFVDLGGGGSEI